MTLKAERLELHPFEARDAATLHRHWNDPEVRRHLFDGGPVSMALVRSQIASSRRWFRERGFGLFTVRRAGRVIGFAGLRPFHGGRRVELLYALRPAQQGRGYATEAAAAVLRLGFARGLRSIWAGPTRRTGRRSASCAGSRSGPRSAGCSGAGPCTTIGYGGPHDPPTRRLDPAR